MLTGPEDPWTDIAAGVEDHSSCSCSFRRVIFAMSTALQAAAEIVQRTVGGEGGRERSTRDPPSDTRKPSVDTPRRRMGSLSLAVEPGYAARLPVVPHDGRIFGRPWVPATSMRLDGTVLPW